MIWAAQEPAISGLYRKSCAAFLRSLEERGFRPAAGLLVILDGAKGLRAAVLDVWGARASVQRCQRHKRENVLSYLPERAKVEWRRKLQRAYAQPTYKTANSALQRGHRELGLLTVGVGKLTRGSGGDAHVASGRGA